MDHVFDIQSSLGAFGRLFSLVFHVCSGCRVKLGGITMSQGNMPMVGLFDI